MQTTDNTQASVRPAKRTEEVGPHMCTCTGRRISPARAVLKGMGVTVALPFLDAMVPAGTAYAKTDAGVAAASRASSRSRWCTASAGSTALGLQKNLWSPAAVGRGIRPVAEQPEPARAVPRLPDHRQQHRRAERRGVPAAGNRRRSLPLERGVPDAGAPEADAGLGRARRHVARSASTRRGSARTRAIPSMQLCIENVDQAGGCAYGYSCVYTDTISWASPTAAAADDPRSARRCSISCSASARRRRSARRTAAPTRASSTG